MAYSDPRKNAKFVDDNNLRPRDNSGGMLHREMKHSTDFGQTGADTKGGEADDVSTGEDDDEIRYPKTR